ncbi:HPr kinase/phosphatase C-terminal domain-containing protein [uncultured Parasphingorhabdus sp.]|uniref:HPr kinase/phosphorylase n=1 Tax=uncultured Parasphingorhabdus sp. TaxID=2709694 RepID=UPI0030DD8F22|tara:strand:- start:45997 stop:46452 length:456 start_codon:yes stop_codon:yes gene_type:complete
MTDISADGDQLNLHATAVAISGAGLMICGKSGSGKSDLALRLIDRGATLISDDYVDISRANEKLFLSPPANLAGKLEVRSMGIVEQDYLSGIPLKLIVKLEDRPDRFPMDKQTMILLGITIPFCTLDAMENSATIKAELALQRILRGAAGI